VLINGRELVLISEEQKSLAEPSPESSSEEEPKEMPPEQEIAEIITFVPRARLTDFQVSHQEHFGVLALQVRATSGGEKLEIIFPSDDEKAISKAMEQVLPGAPKL
jgi:hypothetical protein